MTVTLITGTSSGIGRATALHLGRRGHSVYAAMRNPERAGDLPAIAAREGLAIEIVQIDVNDAASVERGVAAVLRRAGHLDVLVNNAGVAGGGPIEETPDAEVKAIFETNFFGVLRMLRAVLPTMRAQRGGVIVNVSSVAGRVVASPLGVYAASKFALEAASEALAQEVRCFGIRVAIIEPGVVLTPLLRRQVLRPNPESPYADPVRRIGYFFAKLLANRTPPEAVAEAIAAAIESDDPKLRYLVGPEAAQIVEGRARFGDEAWVGPLRPVSDEEWFSFAQAALGIDFRPNQAA
jgi:NAD(P)-dependent dehydrogenase (short-subunit alcohol dehydrogenase family)